MFLFLFFGRLALALPELTFSSVVLMSRTNLDLFLVKVLRDNLLILMHRRKLKHSLFDYFHNSGLIQFIRLKSLFKVGFECVAKFSSKAGLH